MSACKCLQFSSNKATSFICHNKVAHALCAQSAGSQEQVTMTNRDYHIITENACIWAIRCGAAFHWHVPIRYRSPVWQHVLRNGAGCYGSVTRDWARACACVNVCVHDRMYQMDKSKMCVIVPQLTAPPQLIFTNINCLAPCSSSGTFSLFIRSFIKISPRLYLEGCFQHCS